MSSASVHGNSAVIYNASLNQPANTWKGAIIHMDPGQAWVDQTGVVTSSSPGSITISFQNNGAYTTPTAGNQFYLFGKFQALTGPGQWYVDPTTSRLYVWTPNSGNPASEDVEAKHRIDAFNLNGLHDITISGVHIFSAGVMAGYNTRDIVLNGVNAEYVSHQTVIASAWYVAADQGIILQGPDSTIENSIVAYATDDAIVVDGAGSLVQNNLVHDVDSNGTDSAGIHVEAAGITVTHNTVYNSGRHGILTRVPHTTITYNTVHDVSLQTTESGGIYTSNTNGEGSVIAYNDVYNIHTGGFGGTAIFCDNKSSGWIVHNNDTWNVDYGLKMNYTSNNNTIYNNTFGANIFSINSNQLGNWDGVKIYSNVFTKKIVVAPGADIYDNLFAGSSSGGIGAGDFSAGASV